MSNQERSRAFEASSLNRFWWHRRPANNYVPPVYALLSDEEWTIIEEWFRDTEKCGLIGETSIPMLSVLQGFVMGNGALRHLVECGTYAGFSALMLGFMFRRKGCRNAVFSIDVGTSTSDYAREWVRRAGLDDYVRLVNADSSDHTLPQQARAYFGGDPHAVIVDSSHQYEHTGMELDLWFDALADNGLFFMHDSSTFAVQYDITGMGGVRRAVNDWAGKNGIPMLNLNGDYSAEDGAAGRSLFYGDGLGLALMQKPRTFKARTTVAATVATTAR